MAEKLIIQQKKSQDIKRDIDVRQIYLSDRNLDQNDVCDLSKYRNLKKLWLNGNKLRRVKCLKNNYRLSELYLDNNELLEITDAISQLTSLEILHLHNNQLTKLEKVVNELKKMQNLRILNLFDNPIAKETDYRLYVIYHLPTVSLMDRSEVTYEERQEARRIFDQDNEAVRDTIAFMRRSQGPPSLYYSGLSTQRVTTVLDDTEVCNNFYRNSPTYERSEDAAIDRLNKHSKMQFTHFDWSKVPRREERRLADTPFESPEVITVQFR